MFSISRFDSLKLIVVVAAGSSHMEYGIHTKVLFGLILLNPVSDQHSTSIFVGDEYYFGSRLVHCIIGFLCQITL